MELKKNPNIKEMKEVIYGIIEEEKKRIREVDNKERGRCK